MEHSRKRTKKDRTLAVALVTVLLLLLSVAAGIYVKKFMPTSRRADLSQYFDVAGDNVQLYLNDEKQKNDKGYLLIGRYQENHVYLPFDFVLANLNRRFYYAEDLKKLLYSQPAETEQIAPEDTMEDGSHKFFFDGKDLFLNVDFVKMYSDIDFFQNVDSEEKRIFLYNQFLSYTEGTLRSREAVRLKGGVKSEVLTVLPAGSKLKILEQMEKWSKVVSPDGFIGYVRNGKLRDIGELTPVSEFQAPEFHYQNLGSGKKVNLGFHQVLNAAANAGFSKATANVGEMNVIAPTWMHLVSADGGFASLADANYVKLAHDKGLKVWATVNNIDGGSFEIGAFLKSEALRQKMIQGVLREAKEKGIDGLNLDFELIKKADARDYVQFVREFGIACRAAGIVSSVDCYVPYDYNAYYDIEELGTFVDYLVIMCYDEHYAGSGEAGSVSSISYVDRGIQESAAVVDRSRIIIALPFYTRVWKIQKDGSVSSDAFGIAAAQSWVSKKGVSLSWDEETGQNVGSITEGDVEKKIWMEDQDSMKLKMQHLQEANVGGVAFWKLQQEPLGFWNQLTLH